MPPLAKKCVESWRKYLPEYELMCWNENNFNFLSSPYAREAYEKKKYAFVTDYARMYVLYHYGGVYMDTDVEVLKPLDQFLCHKAFSGFENIEYVPTGIIASEKGGAFVKDMLEYYYSHHFLREDGSLDMTTNVQIITDALVKKGLVRNNKFQEIDNYISLYPNDYFCPKIWGSDEIILTPNTHAIHHFLASWKDDERGCLYNYCKKHGKMRFYHQLEKMRLLLTCKNN